MPAGRLHDGLTTGRHRALTVVVLEETDPMGGEP